ncbi:MAG: hypothetical protein QW548_02720 [Candidatus Aenigmatarchaeota archaeon]
MLTAASVEERGVEPMDESKFQLLLDVLKILERHEDANVVESALEIVESNSASLTAEQKAQVLKEVLHLKGHAREDEREQRFQDEWKKLQMKEFFSADYV